jgi:hypothetical protein
MRESTESHCRRARRGCAPRNQVVTPYSNATPRSSAENFREGRGRRLQR